MPTRLRLCFASLAVLTLLAGAGAQTIHTVAGGGPASGTPGTSVAAQPWGMAADASGNVYYTEYQDGSVYKLDTSGNVSRVAGVTANGFSGDGGPATAAELAYPTGVALDPSGNLYISDSGNNRVRVVNTQGGNITVLGVTIAPGHIATVAGNGFYGDTGDGDAATSAEVTPAGVAVDAAGNLYIADPDLSHSVVRKVDTSGTITTVAGKGPYGYSGDGSPATAANLFGPTWVAVDANGNLYISDTSNYRIRKVDSGGTITTVAGNGTQGTSGDGGPATAAQIGGLGALTIDAATGDLYFADSNSVVPISHIRRVDSSGIITTVAGNGTPGDTGDGGTATSAEIECGEGVAFVAGNLFFSDYNRVREVSGGIINTVAGNGTPGQLASGFYPQGGAGFSGDGGSATAAQLTTPYAAAVDAAGNLYFADTDNNRIRVVNMQATGNITVQGVSIAAGDIATVAGNGTSGYSGDGSSAISAKINTPNGLAVDTQGDLFFTDPSDAVVRMVNSAGTIGRVAGGGVGGDGGSATSAALSNPSGVAVDASGNLYIADTNDSRIRVVNMQPSNSITVFGVTVAPGDIATVAGNGTAGYSGDGGLATSAALYYPRAVAVDASGNLYIADGINSRIRRVDAATAIITTVAGNGSLGDTGDGGPATSAKIYYPEAVAVDASGNFYIGDLYGCRVRVVNTQNNGITVLGVNIAPGNIATVAGNGTAGFSGDGGPATSAQLTVAYGLAVDAAGNLYIADTSNNRIRRVDGPQNNTPPPSPSISGEPTNPTNSTSATFTFSDTQSGVSFLCSLDNAAFTACSSGVTYSSLSSSSHTFAVEAKDTLGNTSSATTYTWTINTSAPPSPSISGEPTNPTNSTSATFTFSDTQSGVSFLCSLDNAAFTACSSGVTYSSLSSSSHTFAVEAKDSLGNTSTAASYTWTVSTTSGGLSFSPSAVSFGTVTLWGGTSRVLTVTNNTTSSTKFTSITLGSLQGATAKDLTYDRGCDSPVASGKSCKITLSLWPSKVGPVSAVLALKDNAPGSPQHVTITANVIAPKASLSTSSLNLGSHTINSSMVETLTLSNPGVGALEISGFNISGSNASDFTQTNTCGNSLAANSSCHISVTFKPRARGSRSATLKISDDAQSGTQTVSLSGRGV